MISCGNIEHIVREMTASSTDYVVTGETSMAIRGIGTCVGLPVTFDFIGDVLFRTPSGYAVPNEVDSIPQDGIIEVKGIRCTDALRNIEEMIKRDGYIQSICEEIFYYVKSASVQAFYNYALEHDFLEDAEFYINTVGALEIFNNDDEE